MDNNNYNEMFDKAPYHNFLMPSLSKTLFNAGFYHKCLFWWKSTQDLDNVQLRTWFFDSDDYYRNAEEMTDHICHTDIIPAYTMADIITVLPENLFCERVNGFFRITLPAQYNLNAVYHTRMADAFGLMLLQMIKKGHVRIDQVNEKMQLIFEK